MKEKGLPRGYDVPAHLKPTVQHYCQTSVGLSIATTLIDWAIIALCMRLGAVFVSSGWAWIVLHVFILWPLCSRALRGLENLIHEASHGNWHRGSRKLNNGAANWLCAYWLLLNVAIYRSSHRLHHNRFGTAQDPDKQRFERLQLDQLSRKMPGQFFLAVLRLMPIYVRDYWRQFAGHTRQLGFSLVLHGLVAGLGSLVVEQFWLLWLLYFWVPFLLYLPLHRFLAEAEEHRYAKAQSVYEATFSNLGLVHRWFLHPHGDAYHLLHHLLESIPHWQMPRAYALMSQDPIYIAGMTRISMFEEPQSLRR